MYGGRYQRSMADKKKRQDEEKLQEKAILDVSPKKEFDPFPGRVKEEKSAPQGASPSPTGGKANELRKRFDQFKRRRAPKGMRA